MSSTDKLQSTKMHKFLSKMKKKMFVHNILVNIVLIFAIISKAVQNTFNLLDGNTKASLFMTFVCVQCGFFFVWLSENLLLGSASLEGSLKKLKKKIYRKLFKHLCIREPKVC